MGPSRTEVGCGDPFGLAPRHVGSQRSPDSSSPRCSLPEATPPSDHFIQAYAGEPFHVKVQVAPGVVAELPIGREAVGLVLAELDHRVGDLDAGIAVLEQLALDSHVRVAQRTCTPPRAAMVTSSDSPMASPTPTRWARCSAYSAASLCATPGTPPPPVKL